MVFGSIIRIQEHEELKKITLTGSVLDIGGSRKSGYHGLIKGEHTYTVVNYGEQHPGADLLFNAEEKFPLDDASYDNVLTMNVLEHIFETHNVFAEVSRVIKPGGLFVSTVPYMLHIHGSPDDYVRYTESSYQKFADKYGFKLVYIKPLGYGLFSLIFQTITIYRVFPFAWLFNFMKYIFVGLDKFLLNFSFYKKLAEKIPLGYFWIMEKK